MARGINKVILVGNLGQDPETKAMFLSQVGSAKGSPPQPESVAARVTQSPDATGPAELVFSNTNQPGYFSVTLYPKGQEGLARVVAQWADDLVFGPAMAYNFQPSGAAEVFAGADSAFHDAA